MEWLLNLLGMGSGSGQPTTQQPRVAVPAMGGSPMATTGQQAADASRSAGGRQSTGMSEGMAKILAATLMSDPARITFPGVSIPRQATQPFVFTPQQFAPMADRKGLSRV